MTSPTERRRFSRIPFNTWTELRQGERSWQCRLLDLSLKGLLLSEPEDCVLTAGEPISARIQLADNAEILLQATLVRRQQQQLGLICTSIDIDSISHLRRLVELNLGDADAANRELSELMSI